VFCAFAPCSKKWPAREKGIGPGWLEDFADRITLSPRSVRLRPA